MNPKLFPIWAVKWFDISLFIAKWMFHGFPENIQQIVTGIIFVGIPFLITICR